MSEQKEKPMSNIMFKFMVWGHKWEDRLHLYNPKKRLDRLGIKEGQTVLDFGCGPGRYTITAAKIVGETGRVYALDIHPLAMKSVRKKVEKEGLSNIETILSDRDTGLADESVDVILLYDTLHEIHDKRALLEELHRVLKRDGLFSVDDHHLKGEKAIEVVEKDGLYSLRERDKGLLNFRKGKL
jgi:ubiquinone/menaquinone biosynthesis C-methylase UbiE